MINRGIVYRQYGEMTFVQDITNHKAYLLDGCAGDVLDFCEENPDSSSDQIVAYMQSLYQEEDIAEDIYAFIEALERAGILTCSVADDTLGASDEEEILSKVRQLCVQLDVPLSAVFELTYRCSERCVHCYIDDDLSDAKKQELTLKEYYVVVDQLREMGCMNLLLTGGEVCLHKDFLDITEYAVKKGFCVDIYTNGISMTDEQFDRLCALPLNSVSFSLYGGEEQTHDAITRVPGSFEKTLKRMMMFKCAGIPTYIKTVSIQQNYGKLEPLYQLGQRLGIDVQNSLLITPTHMGADMTPFRLGEVEKYKETLRLDGKYHSFEAVLPRNLDSAICSCGEYVLSVDPYGNVQPCLSMPIVMGNVRTEPLAKIWQSKESFCQFRHMRFRDLDCHPETCPNKDYCTVCMGTAYKEGKGQIRHPEESCMMAQAFAQLQKEVES